MGEWSIEILKGIGMFFLHPLFYLGFIYSVWLGYTRVKRERKNFHIRIQDGWYEFRTYSLKGLLLGLLLSLVLLFVGVQIPWSFILVAGVVTLIFSIVLKPGILSPAWTAGISFLLLFAISYYSLTLPVFSNTFHNIADNVFPNIAFLMSLLLLAEGILIYKNAAKHTSPKVIRSKRGLHVGIHEVRRLWFVPLLLLVPVGKLSLPVEYWPVVPINGDAFTFLLIPYWIGFSQQIKTELPQQAVQKFGKQVIIFSIPVVLTALASFWLPMLAFVSVAIAIIGRAILSLIQKVKNNTQSYYFSKNQFGITILDIIPGSPAEKMNLHIGEVIKTVNGILVNDEREFYQALQKNRAFCKVEVIDRNGENRFVQRALYEGEHHELGVIFIAPEKRWTESAS
ncbi:PDZ domain-containing protein [Bacillus kwashiorkori]|uniref:PDZ domain-containing protein n=1 Tax=Bacillus kwashiorkori TaxID=1522318 RepID=UPI000786506D|nr:PDZ domain-containing protein [Bacillus kwashiorkori]